MADTLKIGQRVVLTNDLTRYHPQLTMGVKGTILAAEARKDPWAGDPRFAHVQFDKAGPWDVLWDGLLPVPPVLDSVDDAQLLAEAKKRGLLDRPPLAGNSVVDCLQFMADYLGPDLWEELLDAFMKKRAITRMEQTYSRPGETAAQTVERVAKGVKGAKKK